MKTKIGLTEAAKEIFAKNVAEKRANGEKMQSYPEMNKIVNIGNAPTELNDDNIEPTKGVPSATPPGKQPDENTKDKSGVGADKPDEEKTTADTDIVQTPEQSTEDITNKKPAKIKQTFETNPNAATYDGKEDLMALFKGESLSPEFKEKCAAIFEATTNAKAEEIAKGIALEYQENYEKSLETIKENLKEQIDEYLVAFVNEWADENAVAIKHNIKTKLSEEFLYKLKDLFDECYIDIPDDKVDVVTELSEEVKSLTDELNEVTDQNIKLQNLVVEHCKHELIQKHSENLSLSQKEKFASLAENITTNNLDEFESKIITIKETYFDNVIKKDETIITEQNEVDDKQPVTEITDSYVSAIAKSLKSYNFK